MYIGYMMLHHRIHTDLKGVDAGVQASTPCTSGVDEKLCRLSRSLCVVCRRLQVAASCMQDVAGCMQDAGALA